MQGQFLKGFAPLRSQIWFNFAEICTGRSIIADKNKVWRTFKKFKFLRKRNGPKVCTFGPTLNPRYSMKMVEFKKLLIFIRRNFNHWNIQICQNYDPIFSSLSRKKTITFYFISAIFGRKGRGNTFQGRNQNLT